jgi:hypothetical protein
LFTSEPKLEIVGVFYYSAHYKVFVMNLISIAK